MAEKMAQKYEPCECLIKWACNESPGWARPGPHEIEFCPTHEAAFEMRRELERLDEFPVATKARVKDLLSRLEQEEADHA